DGGRGDLRGAVAPAVARDHGARGVARRRLEQPDRAERAVPDRRAHRAGAGPEEGAARARRPPGVAHAVGALAHGDADDAAPRAGAERRIPVAADGKTAIWWNGKLVPYADAKTHVLSHVLHYGTGVFEGIRAYRTPKGLAVFRLVEHVERLFHSANCYRMPM